MRFPDLDFSDVAIWGALAALLVLVVVQCARPGEPEPPPCWQPVHRSGLHSLSLKGSMQDGPVFSTPDELIRFAREADLRLCGVHEQSNSSVYGPADAGEDGGTRWR